MFYLRVYSIGVLGYDRGMLYLGADHRGFALKERLHPWLDGRGDAFEDLGATALDPADDYVDFAVAVAKKVSENPQYNRGILICGSGEGMAIAANKFKGVRAALCWNEASAKQSREHGDANILVIPADEFFSDAALAVIAAWLDTPFSGEERHVRRIKKIEDIKDVIA